MTRYNPDIHHRHSIRLRAYDYSQMGAYFVTVCTQNREFIFGEITEGEIRLSDIGQVVVDEWLRTGEVRKNIELDSFVVMPNHFHGIVVISGNGRGVLQYAPTANQTSLRSPSQTIGAIVRGFKSITTKRINIIRNTRGMPVWQRNYYEHIIRTEDELTSLREYIINNPEQWSFDNENPDCVETVNADGKANPVWLPMGIRKW
jgi:putative transposase